MKITFKQAKKATTILNGVCSAGDNGFKLKENRVACMVNLARLSSSMEKLSNEERAIMTGCALTDKITGELLKHDDGNFKFSPEGDSLFIDKIFELNKRQIEIDLASFDNLGKEDEILKDTLELTCIALDCCFLIGDKPEKTKKLK